MARDFAGVGDRLEIDQAVVTAVPLTMGCWFMLDDDTQNGCMLWVGDKDVETSNWELSILGGVAGDPVRAGTYGWTEGLFSGANTTTGATAGQWHHACGVFAAANDRRAFIDGGSKGTNTDTRTPTTADRTSIGRWGRPTPGNYMDGKVAEAAIWDVALSDAEIAALAKGLSPLLFRPGNLKFYAPLWGTSSPERDYTRGVRHLTVTGALAAAHAPVMPFLPGQVWHPSVTAVVATAPTLRTVQSALRW